MTGVTPSARTDFVARVLAFGIGAAALVAAASLFVLGETTSVDANNWLIWARQAATGNAIDPAWAQTSFKPLPVLVAMPFSATSTFAGNAAWLWLVRTCLFACPVLLFLIASRRFGTVAGLVAAVLPFALSTWLGYGIDGDSEPVVAALLLGAALAAAADRTAIVTGALTAAALLRPEALGLLLAWAGWLAVRRDRRAGLAHLAAAMAVVALGWVAFPALLGTSFGEASSTAQGSLLVPNSREGIVSILPTTVWLLVAAGAWGLYRNRDPLLTGVTAGAALWTAEVAALAALGFPGLDRYLYPAAIALCALAGAGAATIASLAPPGPARSAVGAAVVVGAIALAATGLPQAGETFKVRDAKAASASRAVGAFERSGGIERWGGCRPFTANIGYSVIVARMLGEPLGNFAPVGRAPTVAFARTDTPNGTPLVNGAGRPRVVGYAAPDWAILLFPAPGPRGCGR